MIHAIRHRWEDFTERRPGFAQFLMFFVFSNAVTVLQLALMPLFRAWFNTTSLLETTFQVLPVGSNVDGSQYFMFDYPAGELPAGGGGLAYFLAVQITLAIAQIINFFLQRNITFKSNTSAWRAAMWYFIAYVIITFIAAAAQGFYKAPLYDFFIETLDWGSTGETAADVLSMIIYAAISFWVFFPIFKVIFKRVPDQDSSGGAHDQGTVSTGASDETIQSGEPAPRS
jgi:putative flippase GtrA